MLGLRRTKAAPRQPSNVSQEWAAATYTRMERTAQRYSRNVQAMEYIDRAVGIAHICAMINARACSSGTLRLYKRAGTTERRGLRTSAIGAVKSKRMQGGRYGTKLAEFTRYGAEMREVESHPILDFLNAPNTRYPGTRMSFLKWYFNWVTGNGYELVEFEGTTPVVASPLYSQFVRIHVEPDASLIYTFGRSNEVWDTYTEDEVVHYQLYPNPRDALYGMGALHGNLASADLLQKRLVYDVALTENGMRPDFLVTMPENTDPEQAQKFMDRMESRFRGVRNWFKGLPVLGGVDVKPLQWPEKELQSLAKEEKTEKTIRAAFGIPESMADSTESNYASALIGYDDQYLGGTIEPALMDDAATMNSRYLAMFGLDPDTYQLAYDPLVEADQAKVAEKLRLNTGDGILTINEARTELGLETIDDDPMADRLLFNGQPLGTALDPFGFGFGLPSSDVTPDEGPNPPGSAEDKPAALPTPAQPGQQPDTVEPVEGVAQPNKIEETALNGAQIDKLVEVALRISAGELPKEAGRAIIIAAFPGIPPEKIEAIFSQLVEGSSKPADMDTPAVSQQTQEDIAKCVKRYRAAKFVQGVMACESPLWRPCEHSTKDDIAANDDVLKQALARFQGQVQAIALDVVTDMQREALEAAGNGNRANLSGLVDQSAPLFRDAMEDIVRFGVTNLLEAGDLGREVPEEAFSIAPERALQFLDTYSFELAGELADTTVDMAEQAVRSGLEQGLSIREITAQMEGVPEYRAEAIARTETQRAVQSGKMEGAKAVGLTHKRVITAPGVRESHAAIAKRGWVEIDDPFVNAGETVGGETFNRDVMNVPLGVNCRCSVEYGEQP